MDNNPGAAAPQTAGALLEAVKAQQRLAATAQAELTAMLVAFA